MGNKSNENRQRLAASQRILSQDKVVFLFPPSGDYRLLVKEKISSSDEGTCEELPSVNGHTEKKLGEAELLKQDHLTCQAAFLKKLMPELEGSELDLIDKDNGFAVVQRMDENEQQQRRIFQIETDIEEGLQPVPQVAYLWVDFSLVRLEQGLREIKEQVESIKHVNKNIEICLLGRMSENCELEIVLDWIRKLSLYNIYMLSGNNMEALREDPDSWLFKGISDSDQGAVWTQYCFSDLLPSFAVWDRDAELGSNSGEVRFVFGSSAIPLHGDETKSDGSTCTSEDVQLIPDFSKETGDVGYVHTVEEIVLLSRFRKCYFPDAQSVYGTVYAAIQNEITRLEKVHKKYGIFSGGAERKAELVKEALEKLQTAINEADEGRKTLKDVLEAQKHLENALKHRRYAILDRIYDKPEEEVKSYKSYRAAFFGADSENARVCTNKVLNKISSNETTDDRSSPQAETSQSRAIHW